MCVLRKTVFIKSRFLTLSPLCVSMGLSGRGHRAQHTAGPARDSSPLPCDSHRVQNTSKAGFSHYPLFQIDTAISR